MLLTNPIQMSDAIQAKQNDEELTILKEEVKVPRTDWRVLVVGGLVVRNKVQGLGSHQRKRQTPTAFAGGASWAT